MLVERHNIYWFAWSEGLIVTRVKSHISLEGVVKKQGPLKDYRNAKSGLLTQTMICRLIAHIYASHLHQFTYGSKLGASIAEKLNLFRLNAVHLFRSYPQNEKFPDKVSLLADSPMLFFNFCQPHSSCALNLHCLSCLVDYIKSQEQASMCQHRTVQAIGKKYQLLHTCLALKYAPSHTTQFQNKLFASWLIWERFHPHAS